MHDCYTFAFAYTTSSWVRIIFLIFDFSSNISAECKVQILGGFDYTLLDWWVATQMHHFICKFKIPLLVAVLGNFL